MRGSLGIRNSLRRRWVGVARQALHEGEHECRDDKGAGRQYRQRQRWCGENLDGQRGSGGAKQQIHVCHQCALPEDFPHGAQGQQSDGETDRGAEGIHQRPAYGLARGEDFGPAQDHAVSDDDLHEQSDAAVQVEGVGLQYHNREGGEGGDDQHETGQSGLVRNDAPQQRDRGVGADDHEGAGQCQSRRIGNGIADGKQRAEAQQLRPRWVVGDGRAAEIAVIHGLPHSVFARSDRSVWYGLDPPFLSGPCG